MPAEKSELFAQAQELGLNPKEGTPAHILQRMINKANNATPESIPETEASDDDAKTVSIIVGDTLKKEINLAEETNVAFAPKTVFDAAIEDDIRKRVAAQMREDEIRKELQAEAAIARKKQKELKKYDIPYDLMEMKKQAEAILGSRGKIILRPDQGTAIIQVGGYAETINLTSEKRIILRQCQHALTLRSVKTKINDLGQLQETLDISEMRV
jgi:hypothetical protein